MSVVFFQEPQLFLPVLALSLILLVTGAYMIYRTAVVLLERRRTLQWLADGVECLDRCRIANWAEVRGLVAAEAEPGLSAALDKVEEDSADLYHGVWIPAPTPYFRLKELMPSKTRWLFSKEALLLPPAAGLVFAAVSFLTAYIFPSSLVQAGRIGDLIAACALPAVLGFVLLACYSAFYLILGARFRTSIAALGRSIGRKVPVFSEAASMATLIDSFLEYDRRMAAAVTFLNDSVESLASKTLAKAVSGAAERVMRSTIAPAIESSTETMARVAEQVDRNQQEGMKQLSDHFAAALSRDFQKLLQPVAESMDEAAKTLGKAQKNFDVSLALLKEQRAESAALVADVTQSQKSLEKVRSGFLTEISAVAVNLNTLAAASDRMASVYEGNESMLSKSVNGMSSAMTDLAVRMEALFQNAGEDSRRTSEQAAAALQANETHLQEMRKQIEILSDELATRIDQVIIGFGSVTGETLTGFRDTMNAQNDAFTTNVKTLLETMEEESRSMSLYAKEIDMDLSQLNSTLQVSVSEFNQGMAEEIRKTLGVFDVGLAEIVQRLAVSASEIGDAVEALPNALRGIEPR
jgi:hypothetical protein